MAYRDYMKDGTYWTVRKSGSVYWVVRIDNSKGMYERVEVWGGYDRAGAAGGAAAQLAYLQAKRDAAEQLRDKLHSTLEEIGLGPMPAPPKVTAESVAIPASADEGEAEEE